MTEGDDFSFQTEKKKTFTVLYYVLFGFKVVFAAVIGIFYAIKDINKNNTKDFLLAECNMNPIPVALSLLASFMSAITILGTPAEMYKLLVCLLVDRCKLHFCHCWCSPYFHSSLLQASSYQCLRGHCRMKIHQINCPVRPNIATARGITLQKVSIFPEEVNLTSTYEAQLRRQDTGNERH